MTKQRLDQINAEMNAFRGQNEQLVSLNSALNSQCVNLRDEYNSIISQKQSKQASIKQSEQSLQVMQTANKTILQKITGEQSLIKTINNFLSEYNEYEAPVSVEILGSTTEQLNQLSDDINSINNNI